MRSGAPLYVGTGNAYSAPAAATTDAIIAMDLDYRQDLVERSGNARTMYGFPCVSKTPSAKLRPGPRFRIPPPIFGPSPTGTRFSSRDRRAATSGLTIPTRRAPSCGERHLSTTPLSSAGKLVWGGAADEQNAYFGLGPGGIAAVQLRDGQKKWFTLCSPLPALRRVRARMAR